MPGLVPGIPTLLAKRCIHERDGRDKPGLYALKSLLNFFKHHTGTTQWILSFPVLRSLRLSSMSVLGRLAFGR
jgi:hypothetical protein